MNIKINLRPLANRVLVQEVKQAEETKSGLLIPEIAKEKPQEGLVVACGPTASSVRVGTRILYEKYSSVMVRLDGQEMLIIYEDDIIGTLSEEN